MHCRRQAVASVAGVLNSGQTAAVYGDALILIQVKSLPHAASWNLILLTRSLQVVQT